MADLTFSQAERRNFTVPALIAFAILAVIGVILFLRTPFRAADVTVPRTATLPTHTVYPVDTKLVGAQPAAEDAFFVLATVHIHNRLRVPLYINDITGSLTGSDGASITASAVGKIDIANVFLAFPKLKPLASAPLLRESSIQPGADAEGMVMLSFPVAPEVWASRKSAQVTVDFYNQGSFTADIPKP